MTLTVLQVAFPFAPVGPDAVGGAEQVLSLVERRLPGFGIRAVTVACAGSVTAGPLLATPLPPGPITPAVEASVRAAQAEAIRAALRQHRISLVHMHGIDFHHYLPPAGVPVLVTLHLPPGWYPPEVFRPARPDTWLHAVSASQHRACPASPALLPPVENGVAVEDLSLPLSRRRFALVLGRICPEKNQHAAIEAGTRSGIPVLLGGQVFPYEAHERYWRESVLPLLHPPHRFLGPLGFARKRRLLNAARCLVSASLAPETSSLVAMEAMACGTPVVALASGALADLVEDGVTGFLVRDVAEMAAAMRDAPRLSSARIRDVARRRFSADAMVARYASLYRQLAGRGRSHAA
ncbi:glycosyltransferase [Roseicella aquatilis]|uniref:Glycosyltransferase family 4 protein n=1 Tax=Roseicella aquatilis TaxID=2527868 RepID=A0A4R4DJ72_9PROT|nr:glycosyltransferase [Roseicella aquatilis]TCZ61316.1 glycosyltransferase family 4 protein [Roseicella aquatilis]